MLLVGFYRPILTLSMRAFGPRISAYAFWTTTDIHTDIIYHAKSRLNTPVWGSLRSPNYTLHTEHAYCLSYRFLNNVVVTTVIEMVEMVEILDGRLGKRSVERVRYVINNLLHLVIVKYGDISLVLCISTRLRLVTILSLLVKYLVIYPA